MKHGDSRSPRSNEVSVNANPMRLTAAGYSSWAVLEWECCYKDASQGAAEGAPFIESMLIDVPKKAFDDFAGGASDAKRNRRLLGLD